MPDQIQLRGGSEAENDAFTGAQREVTVDTTNKTLRIHDGTTAGGTKLAAYDAWGRLQVADPVNDSDVANKGYVDGNTEGLASFDTGTEVERDAADPKPAYWWNTDTSKLQRWNGTTWDDIGPVDAGGVDVQTFTASDTWTKPAGAKWVVAEVWSGGGGGRSSGTSSASSGGGGGGYVRRVINTTDLGATESVTVGSGGSGGSSGNNGGNGGSSVFADLTVTSGKGAISNFAGGDGGSWDGGAGGDSGANTLPGTATTGGGGGGTDTQSGGNSHFGGGGGGGGRVNGTSLGGTSDLGGNGGQGGSSSQAESGTVPGGGGGGTGNSTATAGSGARGEVRITTYF